MSLTLCLAFVITGVVVLVKRKPAGNTNTVTTQAPGPVVSTTSSDDYENIELNRSRTASSAENSSPTICTRENAAYGHVSKLDS